jgi:hypothetical protein
MNRLRFLVVLILPVLLTGCFFIPGKFVSNMDLRRDGGFTFAYKGEVVFQMPNEKMLGAGGGVASAELPKTWNDKMAVCWSNDDKEVDNFGIYEGDVAPAVAPAKAPKKGRTKFSSYAPADEPIAMPPKSGKAGTAADDAAQGAAQATTEAAEGAAKAADEPDPIIRKCTKKEIADLKQEWEEGKITAAEEEKKSTQMMAGIFGLDPTNPDAMNRFASELQKQAGWRSVVYKGDGVFMVDYYQTGRLDQDFVFPLFPDQQFLMPFVMIKRRADGAVLVETPGFALATNGGMIGAMAAMTDQTSKLDVGEGRKPVRNPLTNIDGKFTLTTDGEILTNNTADGPTAVAGQPAARQLFWEFNDPKDPAPKTLIKLR